MHFALEHSVERQWPYRQHILFCLLTTLLFGCLAPLTLHFALTDHGDAVVYGIRIPAVVAIPLRWSAAALMWSMLALGLIMLWGRLARPDTRIAMTPEGILMPRNRWKAEEEFLRFDQMHDVSLSRYRGHVTMFNMHGPRCTFSIARQMLTQTQFDEITGLIRKRREEAGCRGVGCVGTIGSL